MATERSPFRPDIEGLRGIAILLVVGFHAGIRWLAGGFVGVDVFFVLSGFFITQLLLRELDDTGELDIPKFYGARAMRLLPVLFVVLLATLGAVMLLFAPIDREPVAAAARAVALYAGNLEFARGAVDYFRAGENPLLHTWTLAVEQQFYLVWPALLLLAIASRGGVDRDAVRRRMLYWMLGAAALSLVASLWLTHSAPPWAFFSLLTRLWEFAVGGILGLLLDGSTTPVGRPAVTQLAGIAAILLGVALFNDTTPYPGVAALLPAFGAVALLVGGHAMADTRVSRVLALPGLRWLGRHSYAWYLWHWPVVVVTAALFPAIGVWGKMAWSLAALGLAVLTYRYVESPARNGRGVMSRIPPHGALPAAIAASIAAALLAYGALLAVRAQVARMPQKTFAAARADHLQHECWGTTVEAWQAGSCEFGDRRGSTTLVLLGDSHAEHWLAGLDRAGKARGWKIVAMVKGGCPVAEIPGLVRRRHLYRECTRFREAMLRRIVAMRPDGVILSSWDHYIPTAGQPRSPWQVSAAEWERGLRRTYARLTAAGLPVAAIRGTPRTWFDVPACLSRRAAGVPFAGLCEYDRARSLLGAAVAAQNAAARGLNVAFVNMNDAICATSRCPTMVHGTVVFTDDNHLTATFSRALAPVLGQRLEHALAPRRQALSR